MNNFAFSFNKNFLGWTWKVSSRPDLEDSRQGLPTYIDGWALTYSKAVGKAMMCARNWDGDPDTITFEIQLERQ